MSLRSMPGINAFARLAAGAEQGGVAIPSKNVNTTGAEIRPDARGIHRIGLMNLEGGGTRPF